MIRISDAAQAHFAKLLANQEEGKQIRVFVINPGTPNAECGVSYCPPDADVYKRQVNSRGGPDAHDGAKHRCLAR